MAAGGPQPYAPGAPYRHLFQDFGDNAADFGARLLHFTTQAIIENNNGIQNRIQEFVTNLLQQQGEANAQLIGDLRDNQQAIVDGMQALQRGVAANAGRMRQVRELVAANQPAGVLRQASGVALDFATSVIRGLAAPFTTVPRFFVGDFATALVDIGHGINVYGASLVVAPYALDRAGFPQIAKAITDKRNYILGLAGSEAQAAASAAQEGMAPHVNSAYQYSKDKFRESAEGVVPDFAKPFLFSKKTVEEVNSNSQPHTSLPEDETFKFLFDTPPFSPPPVNTHPTPAPSSTPSFSKLGEVPKSSESSNPPSDLLPLAVLVGTFAIGAMIYSRFVSYYSSSTKKESSPDKTKAS